MLQSEHDEDEKSVSRWCQPHSVVTNQSQATLIQTLLPLLGRLMTVGMYVSKQAYTIKIASCIRALAVGLFYTI